jgi:ABC-type lipoprotein export system ATPase subunit
MAKETKHAHQVIAEAEQNKAKDVIKKFLLDISSSNEMILMGPAGTGKTRIISDLINSNDITITGTEFCAVSNKALTVLYNSICEGIDDLYNTVNFVSRNTNYTSDVESLKKSIVLTTVSKLLGKRQDYTNKGEVIFVKSKWSGINKKTHPLLIIDEFSMIDNYTYNDIMKVAKRNNSKVIFVGDP